MTERGPLRARRIHIAASAGNHVSSEQVNAVHEIARHATRGLLEAGATFVSGIGGEPRREDGLAKVFYWTVLEEIANWSRADMERARGRTPLVKVVATDQALKSIPSERKALWDELLRTDLVAFESLPPGWRSAALVRLRQARYGNALIAIAGAVGVHHLAELYGERTNPVIPLPFDLGSSREEKAKGGYELYQEARSDAARFFTLVGADATAKLLTLDAALAPDTFATRLVDLISTLTPPSAFCIRLMNPKVDDFEDVERWFREVVGPVLDSLGYQKFDLTVAKPESMFLNVEIFRQLHRSALAVCDFTGVRPNVFIEGGYALGREIPTVLAAKRGVELPFDADELTAHPWSPDEALERARERFVSDVRAALTRKPLIS